MINWIQKVSKNNSSRNNLISLVSGNFFFFGVQYFLLILFTKFYNQEIIGVYIFSLALIKPILIPFNLQLRSLFVTDTNDDLDIEDFHSLRIIGNVITLVVIIFFSFFNDNINLIILMCLILIKIVESQSEMCHAIYQKKQEMVFIGVSKWINGFLIFISVFLTVFLGFSMEIALLVWLSISVSVLLFLDLKMAKIKSATFVKMKKYFNLKSLIKIMKFAWPIIPLEIVAKYYESFPNLFVGEKLGLEILAVFGSILYFKAIGGQVLTQTINIIEPKLTLYIKVGSYREFNNLIFKLFVFGAFVAVFIVSFLYFSGEHILRFIFTEEYASYSNILTMVAISSGISYLYAFFSTALTCLRKHKIKVPILFVGLLFIFIITKITVNVSLDIFVKYLIYTELLIGVLFLFSYLYFFKKASNGN